MCMVFTHKSYNSELDEEGGAEVELRFFMPLENIKITPYH